MTFKRRRFQFNITARYVPLTSNLPHFTSIYHDWPPKNLRKKIPNLIQTATIEKSQPENTLTAIDAAHTLMGPPIHIQSGDQFELILLNKLETSGISLHWHGFEMKNSLEYDGVVGLTQNPVSPFGQFVYNFTIDESPGTYWYHTHSGAFGADLYNAVKGPLIVHSNSDESRKVVDKLNQIQQSISSTTQPSISANEMIKPLAYKKERILFFSDGFLMSESLAYMNVMGGLNSPPSKDENGWLVGTHPWEFGTCNGKLREIVHVRPGNTYKFRLICASSMYAFRIRIHNFPMTIVAVDSSPVLPYVVDQIVIHAAERFDVEVTIPYDVAVGETFWIKADTLESKLQGYQNGIRAILNVVNSTSSMFINITDSKIPDPKDDIRIKEEVEQLTTMNCYNNSTKNTEQSRYKLLCIPITDLKPNISSYASPLSEETEVHTVDFHFQPPPQFSHFVRIDNVQWIQHVNPIKSMLQSDFDPNLDMHEHTAMLNIKDYSTSVIIWRNKSTMDHPIHLHGYKMEIIEVITPNKKKDCTLVSCKIRDELINPSKIQSIKNTPRNKSVIKDTFILPAGGAVITRIHTQAPAIWYAHCHLDLHKDDGMALIVNVGNYQAPKDPSWLPNDFPSANTPFMQSRNIKYPACDCFIDHDATLNRVLTENHKCSRDHLCHHVLSQVANLDSYRFVPGITVARSGFFPGWVFAMIVFILTFLISFTIPLVQNFFRKRSQKNTDNSRHSAKTIHLNHHQVSPDDSTIIPEMPTRRITSYDIALNKASAIVYKEETLEFSSHSSFRSSSDSFEITSNAPLWLQMRELLVEDWKQIRPSSINMLRVIEVVGLALLTGIVFHNVVKDANATDFGESISLFFFSLTLWTFNRMYAAIPSYNKWQRVALISSKDGHYSMLALCLARAITIFLAESWWPFIYVFVCFPLAGIAGSITTLIYAGMLLSLNAMCYIALGSLLGTAIKKIPIGMIAATILSQISMVCAGFYTTLPQSISYMRFISPVYYTFGGLLKEVYQWSDSFKCAWGDSEVGVTQCFLEFHVAIDRFKQRGINVATYNDPRSDKILPELIRLSIFYLVVQLLIAIILSINKKK